LLAGALAAFFVAFLAVFLAAFLVVFFAAFLAGDLRTAFLAVFFAGLRAVFLAAFLAVFLVAFFAVLRVDVLATLRVDFFAAVFFVAFFAAFFTAFLATFFLATFLAAALRGAAFLAVFLVAFLATFFFATFLVAMGWLSSSVDLQVLLPSAEPAAGIGPAANRRRAGRVVPDAVRRPSIAGLTKKPAAQCAAGCLHRRAGSIRGGDDACVHRIDHPGGGLSCNARCRPGRTHSLLWPRLVVAKPNHGFFRCQHPLRAPARRRPVAVDRCVAAVAARTAAVIAATRGVLCTQVRKTPCFMHSAQCA